MSGPDRTCPLHGALDDPRGFVARNTRTLALPLLPELVLHLADEVFPLWQLTEEELTATGLPPPFWAFAWAGGQALARYVLDHPETVRGKRVLDFAAGSGLVGIAAARAGASRVLAADLDPLAIAACELNAVANGVSLEVTAEDLVGAAGLAHDVILAGDVFYERPMADRVEAWLGAAAAGGVAVLVGDPERSYFPRHRMRLLARYSVVTSRELEDSELRRTSVWTLAGD